MSWHPRGQYVELGGERVHCVDVGEGPAVLLLHGFLHSSYTWRETVAALAATHRVIAPDLRGFGWSDRPPGDYSPAALAGWLEVLLRALGVSRLHAAVGNSLGGAVLLEHALARPWAVERLVLVSPLAAPLRLPGLPFRLLGWSALAPLFRLTAGNPAFARPALAWAAFRRAGVSDEVLAGFAPLARPGSHAAACAAAGALGRASAALAARLPNLAVPTTLVWGARDRVLPLRYGQAVAALLPAARLEVFEDCGHCPHEEHPERFLAILGEVLAAVDGPLRPTTRPGGAAGGRAPGEATAARTGASE